MVITRCNPQLQRKQRDRLLVFFEDHVTAHNRVKFAKLQTLGSVSLVFDGVVDKAAFGAFHTNLDAINFAPFVLKDRWTKLRDKAPYILMQQSVGDSIVPNFATNTLARTIGLSAILPVVDNPGLPCELAKK